MSEPGWWDLAEAIRGSADERSLLRLGWEPFACYGVPWIQIVVLFRRHHDFTKEQPAQPA